MSSSGWWSCSNYPSMRFGVDFRRATLLGRSFLVIHPCEALRSGGRRVLTMSPRFPAVQVMEVGIPLMTRHTDELLAQILGFIERLAQGEVPHSSDVLKMVMRDLMIARAETKDDPFK